MKSLLKITLIFYCCLLTYIPCLAQDQTSILSSDNPLRSRLDSLVDKKVATYFKDQKAVGLSLALVINGRSFYYNYGQTRYGEGRLPAKTTLYELGSMTKTFTGILLAQAVLDHKLSLDDDIRKYLNGDYPNLSYKGSPVRIKHLSNHTSRITRIFPNLWERPEYKEDDPYSNYSKALLYNGLHRMKMDTLPGMIYAYSNMAVGLEGCILEGIYHQNYFRLITKNILAPLKMTTTRIDLKGIPTGQIAYPHDAGRKVTSFWNLPELPALGALRSTTQDMVKYILANNAESSAAIALSHQRTFGTVEDGMGLNWFLHTTPGGYRVVEHSGGTGGSRSSLQCLPQLNSGFIILTNSLANRNGLEKELLDLVIEQSQPIKKEAR